MSNKKVFIIPIGEVKDFVATLGDVSEESFSDLIWFLLATIHKTIYEEIDNQRTPTSRFVYSEDITTFNIDKDIDKSYVYLRDLIDDITRSFYSYDLQDNVEYDYKVFGDKLFLFMDSVELGNYKR